MDGFKTAGGVTWAEAVAGQSTNYVIDYGEDLALGDTIVTSIWSAPGLTVGSEGMLDSSVNAQIGGGLAGRWYDVSNTVVTVGGDSIRQTFRLYVQAGDTLAVEYPTMFTPTAGGIRDAVSALRRDYLTLGLRRLAPRAEISDEMLASKLVAAEAQVSRDLRVWLTPREVLPWSASQAEIDALQTSGAYVEFEPGYDYSPSFYDGNTWGRLELRQRPVGAVHSIHFVYPSQTTNLYAIPADWIRVDRKYGSISVVPTNASVVLPLNNFILTTLGGGRGIPLMMQVRYRAGLENAARDYPDLVDVIKKSAILRIVDDLLLAASGSSSADGLSQSLSWDVTKFKEGVEKKLNGLREAIHGIRMLAL